MATGGREPDDFQDRLDQIRERIDRAARRAGRSPTEIRLVAVTKTVPAERLRHAAAHGCRMFGENRVQEAIQKIQALSDLPQLEWHLIGPLQTNKVRAVVGQFALVHSIDRLEIAERLDTLARERRLLQDVLLQVNVSGEPTKHGFAPEELRSVAGRMGGLANLRVRGLMTIPEPARVAEDTRPSFRRLKMLAAQLEMEKVPTVSMSELSMGMSADFECAIEEGATLVRVGTALFGARPSLVKKEPL